MEHINIATLIASSKVEGSYVLSELHLGESSNGSPYIHGILSDSSGRIPYVMWNYQGIPSVRDVGCIVSISGNVGTYKDKLQIVCEFIYKADIVNLPYEDYRSIVPHAPINVQSVLEMLNEYIESINDPDLYFITRTLIDRNWSKFTTVPAALNVHHAFINGLLMHTTAMATMASEISKLYGDQIDRDLLISGTILHDIGKVQEFSVLPDTGLVSDYSLDGNTMGHSILGIIMISEVADEMSADPVKVSLLQNMIASHHGKAEYGAAAKAVTLEAEILHSLDSIDSRVQIYTENLSTVEYDTFSPWIKCLDKKIYKHSHIFENTCTNGGEAISLAERFPGLSVEEYFDNYEYYSNL